MDLNALITHLAGQAPGFRARLDAAGLVPGEIRTPEDLHSLPVLRKDDLLSLQAASPPFGGMLACEPGDLKRIFQSPGPLYDPESRTGDYWRWKSALEAAGFRGGDMVLNAFGYHLTPAGAMFEEGLWAAGCAVIPGGVGNLDQQVEALHTLGVTGYVGLPSYLKALLDKADEMGLALQLEKAFVTAEPLPGSLRAHLSARGVTVRQGYGTAECGNLGYECEKEDGWHIPEDAIIEVCDINSGLPLPPGETGEIVVTLFVSDYALVRFGTGDLSALEVTPCGCGRVSHRMVGWLGRMGAATKVRGMFLHPRQVADFMARYPEVAAFQVVITREAHRDELALKVVIAGGVDAASFTGQLAAAAREGLKFRFAVEQVESLPDGIEPLKDERVWDM